MEQIARVLNTVLGEQVHGALGVGQRGSQPAGELLTGMALDGEVEDYQVLVLQPVDLQQQPVAGG